MQTVSIPTAMRAAFERVQVKRVVNTEQAKHIAAAIMDGLTSSKGIMKVPAVNLDVTTRTWKKMVQDGIIVNLNKDQ